MRLLIFLIISLFTAKGFPVSAGLVSFNAYATTNVTTGAYVTFIASTSLATSTIFVCDTSGKFIKMATGAAGSESDLIGLPVSGCATVETGKIIPIGTRISLKALDASATTGGVMLSLSR